MVGHHTKRIVLIKEMLKKSIEIHDKFSAVIEVAYDILSKKKVSEYTTITYIFFPNTLNINESKYPKTKFYNDVRLFLKYDINYTNLDELSNGKKSLLKKTVEKTETYIQNKDEKNRLLFEQHIKMLASTYNNLLKQETQILLSSHAINKENIQLFLNKITKVLTEFRLLVAKVMASNIKEHHKKVVLFADEYMSNAVELELMHLYMLFEKKLNAKEDLIDIISLINYEQKYKKQQDYGSPKDKNLNPEELLYRRNQLKKYIESVFFLNQDVRKDGAVYEQTLLALAAGLAMIFSTGIAFYFQQNYGNFTTPFFIALVVSYMLKDRIKGTVSALFISRSNSFFYDYKIKIINSLDKKIGLFKESFGFVPFKKLDPEVRKLRLQNQIIDIEAKALKEHIIQYKKKIVLFPDKFGSDLSNNNISGLTDITRLNFHRFIQYMDDPKKDYILVKKGAVYSKFANKVYHINIVQKYFTAKGEVYYRYRVVLNRNGIKRIENITLD